MSSRIHEFLLQVKGVESPKSGCYEFDEVSKICEDGFIENPESQMVLTIDKALNDGQGEETVQFRPQEAELKIRPGKKKYCNQNPFRILQFK